MAKQLIITKHNIEFQAVYNAPMVTITSVKYGCCSQKACELIARSYQVMAQFILSIDPMQNAERNHLISFFERKNCEIKMT